MLLGRRFGSEGERGGGEEMGASDALTADVC